MGERLAAKPVTNRALKFAAEYLDCTADDLQIYTINGGYSQNRKSLVGRADKWIFIKEVDVELLENDGAEELSWLKKEFELSQFLSSNNFGIAPEWSKLSPDGTVLLLPAYRAEDGWIWQYPLNNTQATNYITAVLRETKSLESAQFTDTEIAENNLQPRIRDHLAFDDGFEKLLNDTELINKTVSYLKSLLGKSVHSKEIEQLIDFLSKDNQIIKISNCAKRLAKQPQSYFGHGDARSDNIAYNTKTGAVKFVDWNWASYTPKNSDTTEFLVDAARHKIDTSPWFENFNTEILAAMIGFYTKRCASRKGSLAEFSAETAAISLDIYLKIRGNS